MQIFFYLGTRIQSSMFERPSCPSDPRPHAKTCPLSFRARVWASPQDTATMFWASRDTTCSREGMQTYNRAVWIIQMHYMIHWPIYCVYSNINICYSKIHLINTKCFLSYRKLILFYSICCCLFLDILILWLVKQWCKSHNIPSVSNHLVDYMVCAWHF